MHALIIGAGALGLLVGGFIAKGGGSVTYLTRTQIQANLLNKSGLIVDSPVNGSSTFNVKAHHFILTEPSSTKQNHTRIPYSRNDFEGLDLAIITTKQHHVDTILPWVNKFISEDTPLLFLMNGLGHQEKINQQLPHQNIYYGITQMGAFKTVANTVQQRGHGVTRIGPDQKRKAGQGSLPTMETNLPAAESGGTIVTQQDPQGMIAFMNHCRELGLEIDRSDDIESEMWKKCIINACINPLTALFRVQNGALIEEVELRQLMRELYLEAAQLIDLVKPNKKDAILDQDNLWEEIERICKLTAINYSSMLQDIQQGRPTEIDSITGYLLTQAKSAGVSLPNHQFLYKAVQFLQKQTGMSLVQ